jgi:hypothetical protein
MQTSKSYRAQNLSVLAFYGELHIEPHAEATGISVTLTGPKERIDGIEFFESVFDTLMLCESAPPIAGSGSVRITNIHASGSISIAGGRVVVDGKDVTAEATAPAEPLVVTVRVPVGASIELRKVYGNVVVGDVDGELLCGLSGNASLVAGRVRNVNLALDGTGSARIKDARGRVLIRSKGTGDVYASGEVDVLTASTSGTGDIAFVGKAANVDATSTGTGDIRVQSATGSVRERCTGVGTISIRRA